MVTTKGITPARAGNTSLDDCPHAVIKDHPRPCGEYFTGKDSKSSSLGSPPPVRGIRFPPCVSGFPVGITPARAGNTSVRKFLSVS